MLMGCEGVGEWPKHSHGQTASARLPWSCPKVLSSRAAWGLEGAQAPSRSWSHLTGRSSIPETNPLFSSHPWHRRVTDKPVLCVSCVKQLHGLSFVNQGLVAASQKGGCGDREGRRVSSEALESRDGAEVGALGAGAGSSTGPKWLQRASSPHREGGFSILHAEICRTIAL